MSTFDKSSEFNSPALNQLLDELLEQRGFIRAIGTEERGDGIDYRSYSVQVVVPTLVCFGCRAILPKGPKVWGETVSSTAAVLNAGDALGWRKVTLYGRTIYLCPACATKRDKPEWPRRLTEAAK